MIATPSSVVRKRVLVTGGAGFLGLHLCERLLGASNFEALRHDVTVPLQAEADEIYNLACPASPVHYQFDPRSRRSRPPSWARSTCWSWPNA